MTPLHRDVLWTAGAEQVAVATAPGCAWTAASESAFLSVTSGAMGSGPAAVRYTVAANAGAPRTGALMVAGQRVTVYQASPAAFTDHPIERGVTPVKAIHFRELRARIDALRGECGPAGVPVDGPDADARGDVGQARAPDGAARGVGRGVCGRGPCRARLHRPRGHGQRNRDQGGAPDGTADGGGGLGVASRHETHAGVGAGCCNAGLQRRASPGPLNRRPARGWRPRLSSTVAGTRILGGWLAVSQVLPVNRVVTNGATPVLSFAWVSAVIGMRRAGLLSAGTPGVGKE